MRKTVDDSCALPTVQVVLATNGYFNPDLRTELCLALTIAVQLEMGVLGFVTYLSQDGVGLPGCDGMDV
jgi:hypothetical protein